MAEVTCLNDAIIFDAKRGTAKFCSAKCRVEYGRKGLDNIKINPDATLSPADKTKKSNINPNPFAPENQDPNYDRQKALAKFEKMGLQQVEWITTGIPEFDTLTRIPRGRITQIQGPYGVGKTTLCLNMARGISQTARVLYIDSEASLNPNLLVDLGVNYDNFDLYNDSAYFEDIAEVIKAAAKSGKYDIVIFDSLASTTTKAETEGNVTDRNIGQKAFFMHKLVHMTQMDFKNTNTAFVVINQERDKIGGYFPEKYTPGGNAVPYAASLMIALKTTKSARFPTPPKGAKKHLYLGHEVEATIIKSKVNTPWRVQKFKLYYPNPQELDVIDEPVAETEPF